MNEEQIRERTILSELIDLYRDFPCLWDITNETYKDARQKKTAWEILLEKYKELDQNASEASVKKKIDSLKFSYQREAKKVKSSKKRTGSAAIDIHRPNLWYYEQMTFLEKKTEANRSGVDTLISEDEDDPPIEGARKSKLSKRLLEKKKLKLIDSAQDLINEKNKDLNSFGKYVGEKLEQIQGDQREIAEKLISEVIFLAKIKNLSFESKIYTPPKSGNAYPEYNFTPNQFSHSTSTHIPHSSTILSPQHLQSPTSSHIPHNAHPSSTPQPHSTAVYSSQPIQSPTSSHIPHNAHPSSTPQPHSTAVYSSQPIQSPTSSHIPHNAHPSSTPQPHSTAVYSSQPIQSPTSSHIPHNAHPSSTPQPHSTAVYSSQHIQSPTSSHIPHNPLPSSAPQPRSPTIYSTQPIQSPPNQIQSPAPHNPHSLTDLSYAQIDTSQTFENTVFSESSQAFENAVFVVGPAGDILKEMLIFKK